MTATPKNGTLVAYGVKSGKSYLVDFYVSDVDGALVKFDAGAGASSSSPEFYTFPEDVVIKDISIESGTADTTKMRLVVNGKPTSHIIRYSVHLTSLNNRPELQIGVRQGSMVQFIQLA